jgi:hypothetical protein
VSDPPGGNGATTNRNRSLITKSTKGHCNAKGNTPSEHIPLITMLTSWRASVGPASRPHPFWLYNFIAPNGVRSRSCENAYDCTSRGSRVRENTCNQRSRKSRNCENAHDCKSRGFMVARPADPALAKIHVMRDPASPAIVKTHMIASPADSWPDSGFCQGTKD